MLWRQWWYTTDCNLRISRIRKVLIVIHLKYCHIRNDMVQLLELLIHGVKVSGSTLGPQMGYCDWDLFLFHSVSPCGCCDTALEWAKAAPICVLLDSLFTAILQLGACKLRAWIHELKKVIILPYNLSLFDNIYQLHGKTACYRKMLVNNE
jgi:hypothetical protein